MQIVDLPQDLSAPTAELLPMLSSVFMTDSEPLSSEVIAFSMLARHRFLGLTPEDGPKFFQSRASPDVSQAMEILSHLGSAEWHLSPWTWRAAPSEVGGINVFAKVVVTPSDPTVQTDGLALLLSYEAASTTLCPSAPQKEAYVWKFYDVMPPVSFEAWHDSLDKAIDDLPLKYRLHPEEGLGGGGDIDAEEGQIDAPEMSAEDFWEGANSDSSGSGSMIDELEASTQRLRLASSLPRPAHHSHSLPPSPTAVHSPPSIVLSPPAPFSDLHSSYPPQTSRRQQLGQSHTNGNPLPSFAPATAEALAQSHVLPEEVSSLKGTLKGLLELWARAGSSSLDQQLSKLQVFEDVAKQVVQDYERGLKGDHVD